MGPKKIAKQKTQAPPPQKSTESPKKQSARETTDVKMYELSDSSTTSIGQAFNLKNPPFASTPKRSKRLRNKGRAASTEETGRSASGKSRKPQTNIAEEGTFQPGASTSQQNKEKLPTCIAETLRLEKYLKAKLVLETSEIAMYSYHNTSSDSDGQDFDGTNPPFASTLAAAGKKTYGEERASTSQETKQLDKNKRRGPPRKCKSKETNRGQEFQ